MDGLKKQMEAARILASHLFPVGECHVEAAPPVQLEALAHKLETQSSRHAGVLSKDINLEALRGKAVARARGRHVEYDWREAAYLPFVLGDIEEDRNIVDSVVADLNLDSRLIFSRTVFAYFSLFGSRDSSYMVIRLRQQIQKVSHMHPDYLDYVPYLRHNSHLVDDGGPAEMGKHFVHGMEEYLAEIAFPRSLWNGLFVQQAVISFFNNEDIPSAAVMKQYQVISDSMLYASMIPLVAEPLILRADRQEGKRFIPYVVKELNQALGDPRNPAQRRNWNHVKPETVRIYLSWRKKNDLELFFHLVETVIDDSDALRRWKYREAFWENFIDDMVDTRVILNEDAIELAKADPKGELVGYGYLADGGKSKCLLMFSIGDYVFIEPSDLGKLRIYYKAGPIPFYEETGSQAEYRYRDITQNAYTQNGSQVGRLVDSISHLSSETFHWQYRAYDFMVHHCHIGFKSASDWRPRK